MRRNELRTAKGYIEALRLNLEDCQWQIEGIVIPDISEDGKTASYEYAKDKWTDGGLVKEQRRSRSFNSGDFEPAPFDHVFGWQETQFEDSYYGQMLFPLEGKEYLLVGFNC